MAEFVYRETTYWSKVAEKAIHWQPGTVFPTEGLAKLDKLRLNRTSTSIYRIVRVVGAK